LEGTNRGVLMTLRAPDDSVELMKRFTRNKVENSASTYVRDVNPDGYIVEVTLGFRNMTDRPQTLDYVLQGPEGLPLENEEHTRKYRDLELGFLEKDGDLAHASLTAADVTEKAEAAAAAREA